MSPLIQIAGKELGDAAANHIRVRIRGFEAGSPVSQGIRLKTPSLVRKERASGGATPQGVALLNRPEPKERGFRERSSIPIHCEATTADTLVLFVIDIRSGTAEWLSDRMADLNRIYDGFTTLESGVNAGVDPSLIGVNQVAFAVNMTFRGGFAKTRPGMVRVPFVLADPRTATDWTGIFQGAVFYQSLGADGFVVSRGGRLFRFTFGAQLGVTEITPQSTLMVVNAFIVPAVSATVIVNVNDAASLTVGETVYADSGQYQVTAISGDQVTLKYLGGAATQQSVAQGFTVPIAYKTATAFKNLSGAVPPVSVETTNAIYRDTVGLQWYTWTGVSWVITPTPTVQFNLNQQGPSLTVGQQVYLFGGLYSVSIVNGISITVQYLGAPVNVTVAIGTDVLNSGMGNIYTPVGINLNEAETLTVGQTLFIDGGEYHVLTIIGNAITAQYFSGAAHPTVAAGVLVLDSSHNPITVVLTGTTVLDSAHALIITDETNPASYDLVYMFQAENYIIVMGGQHSTIAYDGSTAVQLRGPDLLPPGNLGIYVWGRIWIVQPNGTTFLAGDIVYGPSGTAALGFRDAILKVTENDFLNEGGTFGVPINSGLISAMFALATQDTSLGVGNLLVGTPNVVFSVNTPPDRTTWKALTWPIQTVSLIDYGQIGPRFGASVNGDWWFRTADGIRSFQVARRDINTEGNVPSSREISPILDLDTPGLLQYGSAILFDNILRLTVAPYRDSIGEVAHAGLVHLNYDLISSLKGRAGPAWEGLIDGLNVLQVVKGIVNRVERAFAFALNGTTVELWEFTKDSTRGPPMYPYDVPGANIPIQAWLETRLMNAGDSRQLKVLLTGNIWLDEIVGSVTVNIQYRPDQSPTWQDWAEFVLCGTINDCSAPADCIGGFGVPHYAARQPLPKPLDTICNPMSGRPTIMGYQFQFRIAITGHARIRQFEVAFIPEKEQMEGECPVNQTCTLVQACPEKWFTYSSIS